MCQIARWLNKARKTDIFSFSATFPPSEQHTFVGETSPLSRFRKRIGVEGMEIIESEIFDVLSHAGLVKKDMALLDSTVLTARIAYPNDIALLFKALKKMRTLLHKHLMASEWDHAELKTRWRVFNLERKTASHGVWLAEFYEYFSQGLKQMESVGMANPVFEILNQQTQLKLRGDKHIPERLVSLADCDARPIVKGKKHPKCEFGTSLQMGFNRQGFLIVLETSRGQPYDSTRYLPLLEQFKDRLGSYPKHVVTDLGYRSDENRRQTPEAVKQVFLGKRSDVSPKSQASCCSARSATEGFIAAAKSQYGFRQSRYWGLVGHRIWSKLSQAGYNLKKMMQCYRADQLSETVQIKLGLLSG